MIRRVRRQAGGIGRALRSARRFRSAESAIELSDFSQREDAAVRRRPFDRRVAPGRQSHPPFEPALRQFETVDDRRPHLRRKARAVRTRRVRRLRCGTSTAVGSRRARRPARAPPARFRARPPAAPRRPLETARPAGRTALHALRARQHLERLRPHPVARKIRVHSRIRFWGNRPTLPHPNFAAAYDAAYPTVCAKATNCPSEAAAVCRQPRHRVRRERRNRAPPKHNIGRRSAR